MTVELAIAFFALLLVSDYTFYRFVEESSQRDFEHDFILQHHDFIWQHRGDTSSNDFLPLAFERTHFENLLSLCKQYRYEWLPPYYFNKRSVERFKPKVQIQYIAFRRIPRPFRPNPIRIEMIRCSNRFGIVSAETDHSGYLLERARSGQYKDGAKFHIVEKFHYIDEEEELP